MTGTDEQAKGGVSASETVCFFSTQVHWCGIFADEKKMTEEDINVTLS